MGRLVQLSSPAALIDRISPAEAEERYLAIIDPAEITAELNTVGLPQTRGPFVRKSWSS
jgi:hypothetical protein